MRRKSLIVLCAVFLLGPAGGCTSTSVDEPAQGPAPNYRAIIAKGLIAKTQTYSTGDASYFVDQAGLFLPDLKLDQIEISDTIRMVQSIRNGWAWQACMRLNVNNNPRTFAVFIVDGRAVDARAANPTDNCENSNYSPLDMKEYNALKQGRR
jgi:hypothetical protein